jgi:cytochrome b subunit of formate dehydrogenase
LIFFDHIAEHSLGCVYAIVVSSSPKTFAGEINLSSFIGHKFMGFWFGIRVSDAMVEDAKVGEVTTKEKHRIMSETVSKDSL